MPPAVGDYDYMDENNPPAIKISMDELAGLIESMNYGTARFLAALLRARRVSNKHPNPDKLAEGIKNLLEEGLT